MARDNGDIRLECSGCDAQYDGITERELGELIVAGWRHVERVRSYEDAVRPVDLDANGPGSVFDWQTHMGDCPECADE